MSPDTSPSTLEKIFARSLLDAGLVLSLSVMLETGATLLILFHPAPGVPLFAALITVLSQTVMVTYAGLFLWGAPAFVGFFAGGYVAKAMNMNGPGRRILLNTVIATAVVLVWNYLERSNPFSLTPGFKSAALSAGVALTAQIFVEKFR